MDFYDAVKHIEHSNHESDLYLLATDEARQLAKQYKVSWRYFMNQVTHTLYLEIPFMYRPWWDQRTKKGTL